MKEGEKVVVKQEASDLRRNEIEEIILLSKIRVMTGEEKEKFFSLSKTLQAEGYTETSKEFILLASANLEENAPEVALPKIRKLKGSVGPVKTLFQLCINEIVTDEIDYSALAEPLKEKIESNLSRFGFTLMNPSIYNLEYLAEFIDTVIENSEKWEAVFDEDTQSEVAFTWHFSLAEDFGSILFFICRLFQTEDKESVKKLYGKHFLVFY